MEHIKIELAEIVDYPKILELQKLCFQSEAELYSVCAVDPMKETLEGISSYPGVIYKIIDQNHIIGAGRVRLKGAIAETNKLIVHPDYQGRGLGHKILNLCEDTFPDADFYEIFTGEKSLRNIHLYESHGYIQIGILFKDAGINIIGLKKANPKKLRLNFKPDSITTYQDYKLLWSALPKLKLECISATEDCKYKPGDIFSYNSPYEKPATLCEALSHVLDLYTWRAVLGFPSWNSQDHSAFLIHCPDSNGTIWTLKAE